MLDAVEDEAGCVMLVLELVRGVDLRTLETAFADRRRRLSPPAVAAIGVALCRALAAAQHAFAGGVAHRDVSPHNVLLSVEGEVKLADFGIARAPDRDRWTATGRVKGKTAYLSPEQLRGEPATVRSDLFALGVVLYELLAGTRPFAGPWLGQFDGGERPELRKRAPEVPEALACAVEGFLSPAVEDRPATADRAARLLAASLEPGGSVEELAGAVRSAELWRAARCVAADRAA